jgi:acetate---CoA ligase (ADP-forming)
MVKKKINVKSVMEPKSIAVIGASKNPSKIGHAILKNMLISGYVGKLYAVNPSSNEILGVKCYKSILDIRKKIDCAIISIPAKHVPQALEECGKKGIKGAIIISGGFKEIGEVELENQIIEISEKYGIAVIGPNCLGIVNVEKHLDSIFLPTYKMKRPYSGKISFITQSGAVGSTLLDLIGESSIGISKFISYGNAAVLNEADLLEYLRKDKQTEIIVMYVEGVKQGRRFYEELKKTTLKKPVIVLKAGKGTLASQAAASHTGSLAGDSKVFSSMLKQAGVIEADTLEELFDISKIFLTHLPKGKNIFVLTNGGGSGVLAVDAIENNNMKLVELETKTKTKLKRKLPRHVVVGNPFDVTGDSGNDRYKIVLDEIVKEPKIDAIIVIALFQTAGLNAEVVHDIIHASNSTDKPLVAVAAGGAYTKLQLNILESYGIPSYESPTQAVYVLSKAYWYKKKREMNSKKIKL